MNNRTYIRGTILLCDDTTKNPIKGQYTILKKMETEGASSICYTAKNPQGIKGILKEFYPLNANLLVRDENNQLIQLTDIEQEALDFKHQLAEYINPYRLLCKIRENDDLATVIPPYEVLFGCDEEGKIIGTAYIWSPFPACVTFKDMLKDIHSDIADRPEYKLVQILYSIESLVNAICVLHNAGLVHCDINPSNFGFSKLGSKILTQTISLFDVDTICSVYNPPVFNRGTDGFIEPEYVNSKPNNLTDIFAIGASLFSAIIVTDETRSNNFVYQYSYL